MVAGRLRWLARNAKPPGRITLATFEFPDGQLVFTEAGTKRRAALHLVQGEQALDAMDPGGLDVMNTELAAFAARLKTKNHTLKRALTDPRLFSGIGNAYSDEILHRARLSPLALTASLDAAAVERLFDATRATLSEWTARLRAEAGDEFRRRSPRSATAWPFTAGTPAVPGVRIAGTADRVRGKRGELLRALPDRGEDPGRPGAVATAPQSCRGTSTSWSDESGDSPGGAPRASRSGSGGPRGLFGNRGADQRAGHPFGHLGHLRAFQREHVLQHDHRLGAEHDGQPCTSRSNARFGTCRASGSSASRSRRMRLPRTMRGSAPMVPARSRAHWSSARRSAARSGASYSSIRRKPNPSSRPTRASASSDSGSQRQIGPRPRSPWPARARSGSGSSDTRSRATPAPRSPRR